MIKKVKYIIMLSVIFTVGLYTYSFARITTDDPSVKSGEKVTITIDSQEAVASGAINISSNDGLIFNSVSGGTDNGTLVAFTKTENITNGIATYTFTAPEVSVDTTYKIVFVSQDMADKYGNSISPSMATATVTVKANVTDSTPTTDPEPEPQQPTTPTVTEPNFTSVNRTMYATGDINLRDSWSTSSKATPIEKNTELTVTGTSTDRVNNYIWYRVSYKGQTKYVSSSLITSTKPEENEEEKTNANLKSLSVKGFYLSPTFSKDILEYTLQVQMDTEKLEINAETENEKATLQVQGNETLAEGENIVKIIVTAEDGKNTKTYTIKVNKEEKIFGLQSLIIKDTDIADLFQTDVYEYQIQVENIDKLEIEAIPTNEDATIEILGNEELVEGENIITIIVKSKDEEKTVTYQIKANKKIVVEEPIEEKSINTKYIVFGVIGGIILVALVIIVIYIIKNIKRNRYYKDEEYNAEEYYPEELPEKVESYNNFNLENYEENNEDYEDNEEETNIEEYEDEEDNIEEDDIEDYDDEEIRRRKGKHF